MSDAPLTGEVLPAIFDPSEIDHRDYMAEVPTEELPEEAHPFISGLTEKGRFAPGNTKGQGRKDLFYNPGVVGRMLARLALGTPLNKICRDKDMPSQSLVKTWVREYPEFKAAYESARAEGYDEIALETLRIADTVGATRDEVAKAALRIKTRHHLLGCWDSRYSPKQQHDHTGSFTVKIGAEDSNL